MSASNAVALPAAHVALNLDTRCRDRASAFLTGIYGPDQKISFSRRGEDFHMRFRVAPVGKLRLVRVDVSELDCERSPENVVQIVLPTVGGLRQSTIGTVGEVTAGPQLAAVVRPFRKTRQMTRSGTANILTLPVAALQLEIEQMIGTRRTIESFTELPACIDLRTAVGASLSRCIRSSMCEVQTLEAAGLGHLAQRAFEGQLLTLAASALIPEVANADAHSLTRACPREIVQARDYLHEHAADPVSMAALAASLGLKPRTLQSAFRRQYGMSPRDYLVACRLEKARQALLGSNRSVTEAAYDSGFTDLSHFARRYRHAYGEAPSQTIRRGRSVTG